MDRFVRRARLALTVLTVAAVVAVVAPPASAATSGAYVALGDSFTAGPLIPNQVLTPLGCLRSDRNYPSRLAPSLAPTAFRDVSCSGAQTGDMTSAQGVTPGPNPPQLNAVTADTKVVTLGIGGNDIGFSSIVTGCLALTPWGPTCKGKYVKNGTDSISQKIATTAPRVAAVIDGIRARAPQAAVFVVGYPTILPDTGNGCWPQLPIANSDVSYLRAKHKELNAMLATQAAARGAYYVDTYTPSIGRDACKSASTRWVEPIFPGNAAAPVHPNANGMQGMAGVVLARMRAVGV